jgi:hypothetical protein
MKKPSSRGAAGASSFVFVCVAFFLTFSSSVDGSSALRGSGASEVGLCSSSGCVCVCVCAGSGGGVVCGGEGGAGVHLATI